MALSDRSMLAAERKRRQHQGEWSSGQQCGGKWRYNQHPCPMSMMSDVTMVMEPKGKGSKAKALCPDHASVSFSFLYTSPRAARVPFSSYIASPIHAGWLGWLVVGSLSALCCCCCVYLSVCFPLRYRSAHDWCPHPSSIPARFRPNSYILECCIRVSFTDRYGLRISAVFLVFLVLVLVLVLVFISLLFSLFIFYDCSHRRSLIESRTFWKNGF